MISQFAYPAEIKGFEKFIVENPENHIWHDGSVMRVYTGTDTPKTEIPTVSDLQIRLALINAGLIDAVEQWVTASNDKTIHAWWDRSLRFERDNVMVGAAAKSLGVTPKQLDDLWLLAVTL